MRTCKTCGVEKPLEDFHKTTKAKDGRRAHCKVCRNRRERTEFREANDSRYRRWASANPDRIRDITRNFHDRHPDAQRGYAARWRHTERGSKVVARRRRAKRWLLSPEANDYAETVLADPCSYCGLPSHDVDHIEPIARGGANDWPNLTGACKSCNSSKRDRPLLLFLLSRLPKESLC